MSRTAACAGLAFRAGMIALVGLCCATPGARRLPESDAFDGLVAQVEEARGIEAGRPIAVWAVTPQELRRRVVGIVSAHRSEDEIARYQESLVTIGLWPSGRSLVDEVVGVMGEEVAGLYAVDDRALLIVSDADPPTAAWLEAAIARPDFREVLVHELVHFLQHERYPELLEDDPLYLRQDDLAIALQSALEGDALYFGWRALGTPPPAPETVAILFDGAADASRGALASAPPLLRELLSFPYVAGYPLAQRENGSLLEDPPASSEQVLHPERRRADFEVFDLAAVAHALPAGCRAVFENTVGELQLRVLLRDLGGEDTSPVAWEGWDGDRYLAARCDGRPALLWITHWDSPEDAAEFEAAYGPLAERAAERGGLAGSLALRRVGREVVVSGGALRDRGEALSARARRGRARSLDELRAFDADAGAQTR